MTYLMHVAVLSNQIDNKKEFVSFFFVHFISLLSQLTKCINVHLFHHLFTIIVNTHAKISMTKKNIISQTAHGVGMQ